MQKECPLCGERMYLTTREHIARVPGTTQEVRRTSHEWVCRECDYFEEAEEGEPDARWSPARRSAGSDGEEHLTPQRVLDLLEIERGLTLVA